MDIGGWLRSLGLENYEQAFRENEINEWVLPSLTAEDLKELGVGALDTAVHRRANHTRRTSRRPRRAPPSDGDVL
jgi:hypothetical protein